MDVGIGRGWEVGFNALDFNFYEKNKGTSFGPQQVNPDVRAREIPTATSSKSRARGPDTHSSIAIGIKSLARLASASAPYPSATNSTKGFRPARTGNLLARPTRGIATLAGESPWMARVAWPGRSSSE